MRRCALWLACLLSVPAWADAVSVSLKSRSLLGQGLPAVEVHILEPIAGFELKLKGSNGKELDVKGGGKPGVTRVIDLVQAEGKVHYTGALEVNFPNASRGSVPLDFDAELLGPLKLKFDPKDVDLVARRLTFSLSRAVSKVHLKVTRDTGREVADRDIPFHEEPAGTPLTVEWPEASGKVLTVDLEAHDTSGFYTGVAFSPWQVEIPHDEVGFDAGRWEVRKDEQSKLDASHARIAELVTQYKQLALKLFIVGHTDTVGATPANRVLSLNRALSLGTYLRRKGLKIPVLCEGYGEEALRVVTPDEIDEPRNRRAEYILAVENPVVKGAPFAPKWQRL